jgi:hypothetical protein
MLHRERIKRKDTQAIETWEVLIHQVAVAGRVMDAETRRPVADAVVEIGSDKNNVNLMKRSAADGHYHFLDLPNGEYTARVPGAGARYATVEKQVKVSRDRKGNLQMQIVDLLVQPTVLQGRIVNGTDEPVLLAEVRVKGSGERTFSDADGRYKILGIETSPCKRQVVASAQGYQPKTLPVTIQQCGGRQTLDFTLDRNGTRF